MVSSSCVVDMLSRAERYEHGGTHAVPRYVNDLEWHCPSSEWRCVGVDNRQPTVDAAVEAQPCEGHVLR